jgi:hypothetical protein
VAPPYPVKVIASRAAIRRNRDCIDRTGLPCLRVHRIEQRDHILLERIGDVCTGKTRDLECIEQLRESPPRQAIDVHQMIVAVDSSSREGVCE